MIHRLAHSARSRRDSLSPFEALEERRLMSAALPGTDATVAMDWQGKQIEARSGQWILGLSGKTSLVQGKQPTAQVRALQRRLGVGADVQVEEQLGQAGQFLLQVPEALTYDQVLASTKSLPGFQYVEPNAVLNLEATPNDPAFNYEYGLNNSGTVPFDTGASQADADIDAAEAWDLTTGSSDVVVGVIDSGVDYTHADLAANMWHNPFETPGDGVDNDGNGYVDDVYGADFANEDGDPMDDQGHGTHVAGTIGASGNNGVGVAGVNWHVQIMALKFLAADGSGATSDAVQALNYATSMRKKGVNVRLTSNSWGGGGSEQALRDAIVASGNAGLLFVAAAGNDGSNNDAVESYPSNYDLPNVVAVAATDRWDQLASFSSYGAATVDLAAPGVDIVSTYMGGGYGYMSGTSMATPHVSGVAALAWAYKPTASTQEVRDALLSGVDKLPSLAGKVSTGGRLNALGTLKALGSNLSGSTYDDANGNGARDAGEAALAGRTVYLDLDNDAALDSATSTLASANVPLAVPDLGTVRSALSVAGVGGAITDVDVKLDLAHTYDSDVLVLLTSPAGRTVQLVSGAGGTGDNFTATVLDDEAAASVAAGAAPFSGRYKPQGSLADFDGSNPNGTWTLQVYDNGQYDTGTLRGWSLTLTAGDVAATTDASGKYLFPRLAQGQYVVRQQVPAGWAATAPAAGSHVVDFLLGQAVTGLDFGSRVPAATTTDANDQIAEAGNHAVGYYVTGAVDAPTDVDVYGFDVVAGQRVAFDVDATTGSTVDSYLRLFSAAGAQLAANDNAPAPGEAAGPQSYFEYTFPTAGRYYVAVSGAPNASYDVIGGEGDVAGGAGGYTLTLLNRTVGTDADDQIGEARALAVGATTAAESIGNPTDVDVFKFTAGANQRLAFDVDRTSGSGLDSYLRIFDAAGRQLAYNDNGAAPGESASAASYLEFTFPSAGTYFVAVSGNPNRTYSATTGGGDVSGSTGGYTLTLTSRSTVAGTMGSADQPTVAEVRARRMAVVFSEVPVKGGEVLVGGEAPAALALVTDLEA